MIYWEIVFGIINDNEEEDTRGVDFWLSGIEQETSGHCRQCPGTTTCSSSSWRASSIITPRSGRPFSDRLFFFLLKCRRTKTGDYKKKSASDPNLCWRIVPPPFFAPEAKNPFPPSCLTDGGKKIQLVDGVGCTPPSGLDHPDGCTYPMVPPASELDPRRGVVKRRPGLGVRRAPGRGAPHPEPGWDAAVPHLRADPECQLVPQARAGLV